MFIHERLKPKNWRGQPVAVKQRKYNGHRFTMYKQDDGRLVGFERNMNPDREIMILRPDIVKYDWWKLLVQNLPKMSSIDGELYVPDGNAGDATTAIAKCSDNLEFMAFALPWYNCKEIFHIPVAEARTVVLNMGLCFARTLPIYPTDTLEQLISDAVNLGYEGWVLKQANYQGWFKVKPQKEVDCIVTGFKDGDGKYLGLVGSLKVSVWMDGKLTEIANVSGMSDDIRWGIDEKKDLGRVIEVKYQEVGNKNRLIHAHFVRWRPDKSAEECVYDWSDIK